MKKLELSFVLLTFAFGATAGFSSERALIVTLHNGTAGATVPAGTTVRLEVTRAGGQSLEQVSQTDDRGQATFSQLPVEDDLDFQVTAEHQEVKYPSPVLSYARAETVKDVEVTVYEATEDTADLVVAMAHLFFRPDGQDVRVEEMALVSNQSDRTYVGERTEAGSRRTLRFTLPSAATNVEVASGLMTCCIIVEDNVITDSMEVLPGEKEISFSYRLPIRGLPTMDIERVLDLPAAQAVLVAEDARLETVAGNLTPMEAEGQTMAGVLRGADLRAGDVLKVQLAGLPELPPTGRQLPSGVLVGGLLAIIALGVIFLSRRDRGVVPDQSPQDPQELAKAVAALDLRFRAGEIQAGVYERDRAKLKGKLVDLLNEEDA